MIYSVSKDGSDSRKKYPSGISLHPDNRIPPAVIEIPREVRQATPLSQSSSRAFFPRFSSVEGAHRYPSILSFGPLTNSKLSGSCVCCFQNSTILFSSG